MVNLTNYNKQSRMFQSAISKAAAAKSKVSLQDASSSTYRVKSGVSNWDYLVRFWRGMDRCLWVTCNCEAGRWNNLCHHVISASWLHRARFAMRAKVQAKASRILMGGSSVKTNQSVRRVHQGTQRVS